MIDDIFSPDPDDPEPIAAWLAQRDREYPSGDTRCRCRSCKETTVDEIETTHLRVDWNDQVWLKSEDRDIPLGYIDNDPPWRDGLGPEPNWFLTEMADMYDQWNDAQGNDYRPDARAAFLAANGGLGG